MYTVEIARHDAQQTIAGGNHAGHRVALFRLIIPTLLALALLTACNNSSNTTPRAQTLIKNAQQAIQKVKSYHCNLQGQNVGPGGPLAISSADGDIKVPDRLKATATIAGNAVQIIAIGNQQRSEEHTSE